MYNNLVYCHKDIDVGEYLNHFYITDINKISDVPQNKKQVKLEDIENALNNNTLSDTKQSQKTSDLTVVIPTKNSEAYLTKCLESIKTCKEVIVVDSNSKDKTKSIVDAYGRTYIKFEWNKRNIQKKSLGS